MTVFVTADHHFGHHNIIGYCDRPFDDVNHMNTELINRWCEVIDPRDTVYYLGDFTLLDARAAREYLTRLPGKIVFLPGSHDRWLTDSVAHSEFSVFSRHDYVAPLLEIKYRHKYITLCHYAMRGWPRSFHGSLHLFGHSHGRLPKYGRSMDVGVDTNNFYPYRLDDVVALLTKEEKHGD